MIAELEEQWLERLMHDLVSPMSTLLLWEDILRTAEDEEHRAQALSAIRRSANEQLRLIGDFRDLVRVRRGRITLASNRVALHELVGSEAAGRIGVTACEAWVIGDEERLAQAIDRVIEHAVGRGATNLALSRRDSSYVLAIRLTSKPPEEIEPSLGVAVARVLVELHGGTLDVGDDIALRLPAAPT